MPELAQYILRRSLGSQNGAEASCSGCHRCPVAGELVSVFEGERRLCALCVTTLPESEREPVRTERVHASARHLAVARRARAA